MMRSRENSLSRIEKGTPTGQEKEKRSSKVNIKMSDIGQKNDERQFDQKSFSLSTTLSHPKSRQTRFCCLVIGILIAALVGSVATVGVVWVVNRGAPLEWLHDFKNEATTEIIAPPVFPSFTFFFECNENSKDGMTNNTKHCCNGLKSNCQRRLNDVVFATANNAMSSLDEHFLLPHHNFKLEYALDAGYRALILGTCWCGNEFTFCDGTCERGSRNSTEVLTSVRDFLLVNQNEVVVIHFKVYHESLLDLYHSTQSITGMQDLVYTHTGVGEQWPTMQALIKSNNRLILFQDSQEGCSDMTCPGFIHASADYISNSPTTLKSVAELENYSESCFLEKNTSSDFFLLNHFTSRPSGQVSTANSEDAKLVNAHPILFERKKKCEQKLGRKTNFLAVDFWDLGDAVIVALGSN